MEEGSPEQSVRSSQRGQEGQQYGQGENRKSKEGEHQEREEKRRGAGSSRKRLPASSEEGPYWD